MHPKTYSIHEESVAADVAQKFGVTHAELLNLHKRATEAKSKAYCPYSTFQVGATLLGKDGSWTDGANVENASYPVGTCAERTAFGTAIVAGIRGFKAVGVAANTEQVCSPCGACRQFIREFCELDMPIFMFNTKEEYCVLKLEEAKANLE